MRAIDLADYIIVLGVSENTPRIQTKVTTNDVFSKCYSSS